jgi:hypothetical protein
MKNRGVLLLGASSIFLFGVGARGCDGDSPTSRDCVVDDIVYHDGSAVPAPDECNSCTCEDGVVACTEIACEPGRGECIANGITYQDGASVPSPDGCNTCACNDGLVLCTELACGPDDQACVVDGTSYAHGASVPSPDGCNTCACNDGLVLCTELACPSDACSVFGNVYEDSVPAPDGCNTCSCVDGHVQACTEIACDLAPAIVPCDEISEFPSDPFGLSTLRVNGDELEVEVSYNGGCAPHYFRLCYERAFLESYPVQVQLRLEHDAQGDHCAAHPSETRRFDLTPLAEAYREAYRVEHDRVLLRLGPGAEYSF